MANTPRVDSGQLDDASPFGIGSSHSSALVLSSWLPEIRKTGVTWLRGFDTTAPERRLEEAAQEGVRVAGILMRGVKGRPLTLPVSDLDGWSEYVSTLVSRCKGNVKYWEVWNEPPNFTEDKSPESYAKVVVAAYRAAKRVDPDVSIGLAAQSNHVHWLESAIEAGAKDHFDYITVHPYETLDTVQHGGEALFLNIVPTIRKMLATKNPERAGAPIWFTELGEPVGPKVTPAQQASTVVKAYTLSLAQGVSRVHWFEGKDGDSGPFGLIDGNRQRRPSYTALQALIQALGPIPRYVGWVNIEPSALGFVFAREGVAVMVAWRRTEGVTRLKLDTLVSVVDPIKNTQAKYSDVELTSLPWVIGGLPYSWVKAAETNRARPFPWDGDYSGATSISLTSPDHQSGLHQLSKPSIRWFDGEPARDASSTSGQRFIVDPNFAGYRSGPLRITLVLRRNGARSAGFNLKYESTSGWKGAGPWYHVPEGAGFTTKEYVIDDASFVGKWGYHFSLDSDSPRHSDYSLQRVTVSKINRVAGR